MSLTFSPTRPLREEEWQELQLVLQSGILKKAPNLQNFLEYVAGKYFEGTSEDIKEYSVAVQALHRPEQFDPQSDTIVRVTAHLLRKKLEQYYASEGADHRIQIRLRPGRYVLEFERKGQEPEREPIPAAIPPAVEEPPISIAPASRNSQSPLWVLTIAAAIVLATLGIALQRHERSRLAVKAETPVPGTATSSIQPTSAAAGSAPDREIRIRFGANPKPYVDSAGQTWNADHCEGGSTFSHPNREIQGTDDPELFQNGREGKFQCLIPVPPGTYQLQLLFADTAGDKEGARQVDLSINDVAAAALDIVDEAGGNDVVVGKIYVGIHPMRDGAIHLDFTSFASFVNAAELTRTDSAGMLPLRMLAGPAEFHDDQGNTWLPERFYVGGRRTFRSDNLPKADNSRLFQWERYGNFRYLLPVVPDAQYTVRFYLSEGWFGASNGGPGGVGSREFDIYCNGTTLFKDVDIYKEQKNGIAIITSHGVRATPHGMLDIHFTPGKNYPLINAIEVTPEG